VGKRGSSVLDIVEQIVGDFEDALVDNVLVGSGLQWHMSLHPGHIVWVGEVELTGRQT